MEERKRLNGYYNYTVVLTYLGMLSGFAGIIFAIGTRIKLSVMCLMVAGLCDMFDGTVAATKQRDEKEKKFGIQIDSLSDLVCFGVLPALITYTMTDNSIWAAVCGGFYALCALIRLAYFNVCEEERQNTESCSRRHYAGLPVTSAALIIPLVAIIIEYINVQTILFPLLVLIAMAVAFISTFKIKKPHTAGKIAVGAAGLVLFVILLLI